MVCISFFQSFRDSLARSTSLGSWVVCSLSHPVFCASILFFFSNIALEFYFRRNNLSLSIYVSFLPKIKINELLKVIFGCVFWVIKFISPPFFITTEIYLVVVEIQLSPLIANSLVFNDLLNVEKIDDACLSNVCEK